MPLPETLLRNIADQAGGKVALVIGAGCSFEAPTSLPLTGDLAQACFRRLVDDGVIRSGDVANQRDLTEVADAVFASEGRQRALVERFPPRQFKNASPNRGHTLAAALLKENAVSSIITLNFDHAMSTAVGMMDASTVETLYGPEDYAQVGTNNLVYLHRHAGADPEVWILRREELANAWVDSWQEVLANRLLASPVVVFAGLGSPAAVLIDSIARMKRAVGDGCHVCFVDPNDSTGNPFAVEVNPDSTIQSGWVPFMEMLADRVVREQRARLEEACAALVLAESWDDVDFTTELDDLLRLGLIELGRVRSEWLLQQTTYFPDSTAEARTWLADLLISVALVAQSTATTAHFMEGGLVEFRHGNTIRCVAALAHGRGSMRWARLDIELLAREKQRPVTRRPSLIIVSGHVGERIDPATPRDIVGEPDAGDIMVPTPALRVTTDEIRSKPTLVFEDCDAL